MAVPRDLELFSLNRPPMRRMQSNNSMVMNLTEDALMSVRTVSPAPRPAKCMAADTGVTEALVVVVLMVVEDTDSEADMDVGATEAAMDVADMEGMDTLMADMLVHTTLRLLLTISLIMLLRAERTPIQFLCRMYAPTSAC